METNIDPHQRDPVISRLVPWNVDSECVVERTKYELNSTSETNPNDTQRKPTISTRTRCIDYIKISILFVGQLAGQCRFLVA